MVRAGVPLVKKTLCLQELYLNIDFILFIYLSSDSHTPGWLPINRRSTAVDQPQLMLVFLLSTGDVQRGVPATPPAMNAWRQNCGMGQFKRQVLLETPYGLADISEALA